MLIKYKLLSLTYKILTIIQPPYLYNFISVQRPLSTRSYVVILLLGHQHHPLWNNWSLLSLCFTWSLESTPFISSTTLFWYQFLNFRLTHCPIPSPITSSSFVSPPCSSVTPSLFHSLLKTLAYLFHKSYLSPVILLIPSGLPSRTKYHLDRFFWATRFLVFSFYLFFIFGVVRKIKPAITSRQLSSARKYTVS